MKSEKVGDATFETWTVDEVARAFDANEIVLIDVRTPQEYMFEHIEGALLMPLAFFKGDKLPDQGKKRIVFHCGSGVRSERVARAAIAAGVTPIAHMEGGFGAWKEAKKPFIGTNMATGAPQSVTPE
ncbi:rhodanese-like domain-containing protein [Lutimaribacter sp. EGI FJ00015]|uniref:Rhodanese-like domain-containing protein n=1 Tax=Lutimaribacter degradans TaxID=2945989 RepID=A0ACC5ZU22_9RHOB|nr:rhodanese-like domain-containing protein [Lutimaribacter sp. EGI FJ00013]MCM2561821.1 rhodanese-like domain-containing protein [Lutimaribacter sp. EGI FJ00013]MCO0613146.1 rhodanese-like domain-containing protein [Lutimaribacter sp. EGI FJ00015]MCO0635654.1 rhodanese-like domain-containing protein [Lutimaribacter sp. EGI FJ00014]